ncbi:MAG: ethanolamine utilization protein EutJ, partial [Deltaproteobacteria bacterium]|nr:ethanolamine utilization protein EutJ [Deltaproteobacteria bacterium]
MRTLIQVAVAAAAVALSTVACQKASLQSISGPATAPSTTAPPGPDASGLAKSDLVVGVVGSLSGAEATFGDSTRKGIELALREINARGGLKERLVRVVVI